MTIASTDELPRVTAAPTASWRLRCDVLDHELRLDRAVGVLGRARGVAYRLHHPTVSRHHAQLEHVLDQLVLSDLGSRAGTYLDGVPVDVPVPLTHGSVARVGDLELVVVAPGLRVPEATPPTRIVPPVPPADDPLTPRQHEVLRGMADGLTNAEIAARLGLAPRTVKAYAAEIFDRLGTRTRAGAVAVGLRTGLLAV